MKKINFKEISLSNIAIIASIVTAIVIGMTKTELIGILKTGLMPVMSAFIIAYFMDYVVKILNEKLKIRRSFSILLTVLLLGLFFYLIGIFLMPALTRAATSLYRTVNNTTINIERIFHIELNMDLVETIKKQLNSSILSIAQGLTKFSGATIFKVFTEVSKLAAALISAFVSLSIAIYMLIEKKDLIARIKRMMHAFLKEGTINEINRIAKLTDKIFRNFVIGKIIDSIIIGILTYVVLLIFKFEYSLLIAFLVGITNLIPYFGPFIGAVPAILITLLVSYSNPIRVVYMALIILGIQQLDGLVIGPRILGDSVGVSPFWIIVAVAVGGKTFGVIGMFLGVPTTVLIKSLIEQEVHKKLTKNNKQDYETENIRGKVYHD